MKDLSLHILDLVENSVTAGATRIEMEIIEDTVQRTLTLIIEDNGKGMENSASVRLTDPFYTTKPSKEVGLGLPLLEQAARNTGGRLDIEPAGARGLRIRASFFTEHIDMKPLGNLADTLINILAGYSDRITLVYSHKVGKTEFCFDTEDLEKQLGDLTLNDPEVIGFLRERIQQGLKKIKTGRYIYDEA